MSSNKNKNKNKDENKNPVKTKKFNKNFIVTPKNIPSIQNEGIEKPTVFDYIEMNGLSFRQVQSLVNTGQLDVYASETELKKKIKEVFN